MQYKCAGKNVDFIAKAQLLNTPLKSEIEVV